MAEALRYKDKVTIVTGGSKGIGRGCVEVFGKLLHFAFQQYRHVFIHVPILSTRHISDYKKKLELDLPYLDKAASKDLIV